MCFFIFPLVCWWYKVRDLRLLGLLVDLVVGGLRLKGFPKANRKLKESLQLEVVWHMSSPRSLKIWRLNFVTCHNIYIYITVFVRLLWSEVLMSCQHYTSLKNIYVLLRIGPQERSECYAIDLNGAAQRPPATQDPGAVQTAVWRIFGRVSLQHKHVDKHILCVYTCSLSNCSQFNLWLSCGIRLPSLSSMANLTDFKDELIETVTYQ